MALRFRPMRTEEDAAAFRALNETWIMQHFTLEPQDRITLNDPFEAIVRPGGQVYIAEEDGKVIGTAAWIRHSDNVYELSKMATAAQARGRRIGRQLLLYMLAQAKELGARRVFFGSSPKLPAAVHLYEAVGFRHVPQSKLPELRYARASIFMVKDIDNQPA